MHRIPYTNYHLVMKSMNARTSMEYYSVGGGITRKNNSE